MGGKIRAARKRSVSTLRSPCGGDHTLSVSAVRQGHQLLALNTPLRTTGMALSLGIQAISMPPLHHISTGKWHSGQSSTSFTELMSIDGVCSLLPMFSLYLNFFSLKVSERLGLSFKNSRELNNLVDQSLPGRPAFKQAEVIAGGEVFNVYYHDIVACIKVLFSDPDFAAVLVFAPERHYTDETKATCMYHDMHTGKWWWATQVSDRITSCHILFNYLSARVGEIPPWCDDHPNNHIIRQNAAHLIPKQERIPNIFNNWQHPEGGAA